MYLKIPASLTSFPWASAPLFEAATALGKAARVAPELQPVADTASFIAQHSHGEASQEALLELLQSKGVTDPVSCLGSKDQKALQRTLSTQGDERPVPVPEALKRLVHGILGWKRKGPRLLPILAAIASAHNLPIFILALEHHLLGYSTEDYSDALGRLAILEIGCTVKNRSITGDFRTTQRATYLSTLLVEQFPTDLFPEERSPAFLTDLLLQRPRLETSLSPSLPMNLLTGHLSRLMQWKVGYVEQGATPRVCDMEAGRIFELYPHIRFSDFQGPTGPFEAIVSFVLWQAGMVALKQTASADCPPPEKLFRAGLEVFPDSPLLLKTLAELKK